MGLTLLTRQALGPQERHFEWRNIAQVRVKVSTLPPPCVCVVVASRLVAMYIMRWSM